MTFHKPLRRLDMAMPEILALYRTGYSCDEIARKFSCLGGSIHRRLQRAGAPLRSVQSRRPRMTVHSNGYIKWDGQYVHRIVAEAVLERPLVVGEVVHHKDGDKRNNHPDNLQVFTNHSLHMQAEAPLRTKWTSDRDAALRYLRDGNCTSREIGHVLGFSRTAVDNRVAKLRRRGAL